MTATKTPFAGYTRPAPGDPLSEDGYSFQFINPLIADQLGELGAVTHKHDAHAAMVDPTAAATVALADTGGSIPSSTSIYVAYTLTDGNGGESLPTDAIVVTTTAGYTTPGSPTVVADYTAGTLLAGTPLYAITASDGAGGETALGSAITLTVAPGHANARALLSGLTALTNAASGSSTSAMWRVWKSVDGGSSWNLMGTGLYSTDTFTDSGSGGDCTVSPPATGTTVGTSALGVTVPSAGQPAEAAFFSIYACLDGAFLAPSQLGTYPIADFDATQTYTSLALLNGQPPAVSRCYPGADQINPGTDLAQDGATDGQALVWSDADGQWEPGAGGGGGGGGPWIAVAGTADGKIFDDGICNSSTSFQTSSAHFVLGDVGKLIAIQGALSTGADTATLVTTIAAFISSTHVTLAAAADQTATALSFVFGTDNLTAQNAQLGTPQGSPILAAAGIYMTSDTLVVKGNDLYGIAGQTFFLTTSADDCFSLQTTSSLHKGSSLIDIAPCTALNWSAPLGSPSAPASGLAVNIPTSSHGDPDGSYFRVRLACPKGNNNIPQPCYAGVAVGSYGSNPARFDIDGQIYAQDGIPCTLACSNTASLQRVSAALVDWDYLSTGNPDINAIAGNIILDNPTGAFASAGAGLLVANGGAVAFLKCIGGELRKITISPPAASSVAEANFADTTLTNGGFTINPSGGGTAAKVSFDNIRTSGAVAIDGGTQHRLDNSDIGGAITVAANVSRFKIRGNDATSITVGSGSSDRYIITDNDCNGTAVTDGGSGSNKVVSDNI